MRRGAILGMAGCGGLVLAAAVAASLHVPDFVAAAGLLALAALVAFGAVGRRPVALTFGWALLGVVALLGFFLPGSALLSTGVAGPLWPEQAAGYRWVTGFRFREARVVTGNRAVITYRGIPGGRRSSQEFVISWAAAPVVGPGWTPARPVQVWAVVRGPANAPLAESAIPGDWAAPLGAGTLLHFGADERMRETIAAAERRHGLVSAPDAVAVRWTADPNADRLQDALLLLLLAGGGGAGLALIRWLDGRARTVRA